MTALTFSRLGPALGEGARRSGPPGWMTWKKKAQVCFSPSSAQRLRRVGREPPMKAPTISLISDRP